MRAVARASLVFLVGLVLVVAMALVAGPAVIRAALRPRLQLGLIAESGETRTLGLVAGRAVRPIEPRGAIDVLTRFTSLPMQAAQPPEVGELDLRPYHGHAIVIQGRVSGEWLYGAQVVAVASPWQTTLIRWGWWAR